MKTTIDLLKEAQTALAALSNIRSKNGSQATYELHMKTNFFAAATMAALRETIAAEMRLPPVLQMSQPVDSIGEAHFTTCTLGQA